MGSPRSLLLDIWRESCRHSGIEQATAAIAPILAHQLPIERVLVRRIDLAHSCVETVAVAAPKSGPAREPMRTPCEPVQLKTLLAWCRRGSSVHLRRGETPRGAAALLIPFSADGELLVGPLVTEGDLAGALVLAARTPERFTPAHRQLHEALLEPFSAALGNDQRLREMSALREAAEADRRALLARLGRETLVDQIVGAESGLRHVMERVDLVSRSDVPVLIFGETGTGKELVARSIHSRSARASGPFLRVNCGAIPHELLDSELFGHERGSFTGAVATRRGWFERADGGTLFLDEIGELPLAAQVRLLGVVQDGCFERVGGQQQIKVDVRIVAATHRDLTAMVRESKFREDLWYRLAVFTILLPPLRERPEDVPALAHHLAQRAATRFGLPLRLPSAADLTLLVQYRWPGNIRELAAVIDRAALLADGPGLEVARALGAGPHPAAPPVELATPPPLGAAPQPSVAPLTAAMRRHIEAALAATRGRIEGPYGAAVLLQINPHTLRARMRKLGIEWRGFRHRGLV